MGNIFSGSEIVELGIQIEKNGRDFYDILVTKAKHSKAQDIFEYLSGEEEKHIVVFNKLLDSIGKYTLLGLNADQYFVYMNALAREYVFTKKDKGREIAKKTKTEKEAIDLGIGFEKDSIIFYQEMKKVVPEYEHKIIDELIAQEKNHFKTLSDLKKTL
jgi:rubrerythrin